MTVKKISAEQRARAEKERERQRKKSEALRAGGRDIGPTLEIFDPERRESCRYDFALFCKTYNPRAFYLEWSQIHLDAIARIEESVLSGAMYAFALPRGTGKTTLSKMAALWAISYGHCRYVFLIGSTQTKAEKLLSSLKMWMRFNKKYVEDFPEISQSARELKGKGNAAAGQTQGGNETMVTWAKEEIVLATVEPPPNLDLSTYEDHDSEYAPTSGSIVAAAGLTSESLRGSVKTTIDGDEIRPDFVLADDPQTDESAKSVKQNQDRYEIMTGAVLGMAGPDKDIAMLMPCTIIRSGDMVDTVLDRKRNPLFRGSVSGILTKMPDNLEAWEPYFELYQWGAMQEPPNFDEANKYYLDNQKELNAGCEATWPGRKKKWEVSAVQSAMNLYCVNAKTFYAEYMNQPRDDNEETIFLTADEITRKQHPYERFECDQDITTITAYIDVQQELLFYAIVGWTQKFSGFVLDYGTFPDQKRLQFEKRSVPATLTSRYPRMTEDGRIYAALTEFKDVLLKIRLKRKSDDAILQIDNIGVDRGYKPSTVKRFVRDAQDNRIIPAFGGKWTGTEKPMNHPDYVKKWTEGGRRLGPNWRIGDASQGVQSMETNPNFWKTFLHERFATPFGDEGSLSLFSQEDFRHHLFANHLTAEYREKIETKYGKFDVWKNKPGSGDNDWLDCMVGCCVMASYSGLKVIGLDEEERGSPRPAPVDWSQWEQA